MISKAVILAGGLGTRMRKEDPAAETTPEQAAAAKSGVKAMIPLGRPFLDYLLSALADAGFRDVCIITGPDHLRVRFHYENLATEKLRISGSIQHTPRGTADAVAAAEDFVGQDEFLAINSDNYYPGDALRAARALEGPGLVAFSARALVDDAGIAPMRVMSFPVVETDTAGFLAGFEPLRAPQGYNERQGRQGDAGGKPDRYVSMNCWRFGPSIFPACRSIPPSPRGELELPDAVLHSMKSGQRYRVVKCDQGVLDLSGRADIAAVGARLESVPVRL